MMTNYVCKTCGGRLISKDDATWECEYCKNVYADENVKRDTDTIRKLLDAQKIEQVNNLRRNLYDAVNAKYIDSEEIVRICSAIKALLPDDLMADFYHTANAKSEKETAEYINSLDVTECGEYAEEIIKFLLRSFSSEYHLPLAGLIERRFRGEDHERLEYYNTLLSEEAEKDNMGVYEPSVSRDVFVAYSGKDMESVYPLVSYLEASGLTCFVAARNLRHGKGAVQNYNSAIKTAISNCRSVVLVSTQNSRSFSCDALRIELPHIKQEDINNAPYEFRQNYLTMPLKYKKPRVEYRIGESKASNAADATVKEFFEGCEYAYTAEEVAMRIIKLLSESPAEDTPISTPPAAPRAEETPKKEKAKPQKAPKPKKKKKGAVKMLLVILAVLIAVGAGVGGYASHLTSIEGMFEYDVSGSSAEITGINVLAQQTCTILRIPDKLDGYTVKYINKLAFGANEKIFRVEMTDNIVEIRENAFSACKELYTVILSENLINIHESAFSYCTELTEIELPESVKYIGERAFVGCSSLRKMKIPSKVTHIFEGTFSECSYLREVTLPAGLEEIRENAFSDCPSLDTIIFEGSEAEWESIPKGENWNGGRDIHIEFKGEGGIYSDTPAE